MTAEYVSRDGLLLHRGELLLHLEAGSEVLIGPDLFLVVDASTRGGEGGLVRRLTVEPL